MGTLFLKGFIRDATYTSYLNPERFEAYDIPQFDVNQAQAYGLIDLGNGFITHSTSIQKRLQSSQLSKMRERVRRIMIGLTLSHSHG